MTRTEALALLKRVTYKPGWSFQLTEDVDNQVRLIIVTAPVYDATNKASRIAEGLTTAQVGAIHGMNQTEFLRWIDNVILTLEVHEAREWLQLDNKPIIPQH